MNQPKRKRTLQIHVSFEVSRLSSEYLANAYEQLLPPVRRVTSPTQASPVIDLKFTLNPMQGDDHECS